MYSRTLVMGADAVGVSVAEAVVQSSIKFKVSSVAYYKVVSGARYSVDWVPLVIGAYVVTVAEAVPRTSALTWIRSII